MRLKITFCPRVAPRTERSARPCEARSRGARAPDAPAQAARRASFACVVQGCPVLCWSAKERSKHLTAEHMYPPGYCYDLQRKGGRRRWAKRGVAVSGGGDQEEDCRMEDVVQGRRTTNEKKIKHRKKKKKKDKKKTGKRPVDTPVTKSNHVDGGDDVMMGLTDTMQRVSLVPRSVSFGRRARNRAPERSLQRQR